MSDDITSTAKSAEAAASAAAAEAAEAAKGAQSRTEEKVADTAEKVEEAKEKFEEVAKEEVNNLGREASGDRKGAASDKSKKPEDGDDHSMLGDLWKGAKKWFGPK